MPSFAPLGESRQLRQRLGHRLLAFYLNGTLNSINAILNSSEIDLSTARLCLRKASTADAPALLHYHQSNRDHLEPWEPLRGDAFYTLGSIRHRLAEREQDMAVGRALHLLLFRRGTGALLGECNFTNIVRGPFQACHLGFSIDLNAQGQGLMHEALACAMDFVFSHGRLHRVMANHRPENHRSARLLARLGFEREGTARAYLKINGEWADHVLTSRINDASI